MHTFPNYQQDGHVFLARGQVLMVRRSHWSQRYIRAVIKHFFEHQCLYPGHEFYQFYSFPPTAQYTPRITCLISLRLMSWLDIDPRARVSFVKWGTSKRHKLLIHHYEICSTQGFQNYHAATFWCPNTWVYSKPQSLVSQTLGLRPLISL